MGKGASLAKVDISEGYRNVPVHSDDKHLRGINWNGQVYIDATLPFSSHSFHIGAALTAADVALPDWRIQTLARWSSNCFATYFCTDSES